MPSGRCDIQSRTIQLVSVPEDENDLLLLLSHEICHAVTTTDHLKLWSELMERTAVRARRLGYEKLANMIEKQVTDYTEAVQYDATYVYYEIEDFVLENPDADFYQVVDVVAQRVGLHLMELTERYQRCREAYERARTQIERSRVNSNEISG